MTAVEWFIEQIYIGKFATLRDQCEAIEQALEMEKQQIKEANIVGVNCALYGYRNAEQYFNKTYKKQGKFQQKLQEVVEQSEAKKAKDKLDILYLELYRWKNIERKI